MNFTVHQIFFDFYSNGFNDLFSESSLRFERWAEGNGYEYKLWGEWECESLIREYPEFEGVYQTARFPIMKVDMMKLLILHSEGGLYADLDVFPQRESVKMGDLILTFDKTTGGGSRQRKKQLGTEIIQSSKGNPFLLDLLRYNKSQISEKEKIEVYENRKARFVTHTTRPNCLQRFLRINPGIGYDTYTTNTLEFGEKWKYMGLGETEGVDFISHHSASWYGLLGESGSRKSS